MKKFLVPSFYINNYIRDFDAVAQAHGLKGRRLPKGSLLTIPGTINNTAHYVCSGIVHLSLSHSSGNTKSLFFYGPKTIFPLEVVPHENPIDYELVLQAFTDIEVISFSYPVLRQLCVENGELAAQILEQNCDSVGYLYYQQMNHAYSPTLIRVCDILYIYLASFQPRDGVIGLSQRELADLVGCSRPQLERILGALRSEGILSTGRGRLTVPQVSRLAEKCSDSLRETFSGAGPFEPIPFP